MADETQITLDVWIFAFQKGERKPLLEFKIHDFMLICFVLFIMHPEQCMMLWALLLRIRLDLWHQTIWTCYLKDRTLQKGN